MTTRAGSLRMRLTAAFVAVAVVPLVLTGTAALLFGLRSVGGEVKARNLQLARAVAGEVGRSLDRERWELHELAEHIERRTQAADAAALDEALAERRGGNPALTRVYVLDGTGHVLAASPRDPDALRTDWSRLPYVSAARASGVDTWSSATVAPDTGEPRVAVVVPRRDVTLVGYLDLSLVVNLVTSSGGVRASAVSLLDRDGTFVAHADPALARERQGMLDQPLVLAAVRGVEGTAELRWRGRAWLGSAVPVPLTGWVVLVTEPLEEAYASAGELRTLLGASLLLVLAAAALAGLGLTRRLVRPMEALSARAREVAAGRYEQAADPLPGGDVREIGELSRSFASMAGEVRAREEALARSERELRAIVENVIVGIARTRRDGTIVFANPGLARIVRADSPAQLVGRSIVPAWRDPAQRKLMLDLLESEGRVANLEVDLRALDGTERTVLVNVASDEQHLTTLIVDVTDQKRAAADRERLEEELRHSQKMEAVGRLAGGVAHDFNNLLTAIVGFAGLLRDSIPPGTEDRQSLDGILESAQRAGHLTQSLLAYSRKQVLRRRPVDLCEVVSAVEKLLRRLIGEDVLLHVSLPAEPLVVIADTGQLEQVLVNLATNARDAMPDGGTLAIAADAVELPGALASGLGLRRGGRFARLTVEDTGVGMPDELRAKIFEPFFTTKPAGKGTGLGLSIVDGIVRQHAGHVAVESTQGEGTTFTILLEREDALPQAEELPGRRAAPAGKGTILLAEDEPLVRKAFRRTLERAGYQVVEAVDGEEAVTVFRATPARFDLCLVDMVMPRRNGRETASAIAAIRPDVPVLLASGYAADVLADRGQLQPGAEFVTKPVAPEELLAKVRALIESRPRAGA